MTFVSSQSNDMFPIYGVYCGLWHTDLYGREPVDQLDRYCQYHDICVGSLGYTSCFCNEQLYHLVSNFKPETPTHNQVKNDMLGYIYLSIAKCSNYYWFDRYYYISSVKIPGYNYLPFYQSGKTYSFSADKPIYMVKLNNDNYYNFTHSLYNNVSVVNDYPNVDIDSGKFTVDDKEIITLVSPYNEPLRLQIDEIPNCQLALGYRVIAWVQLPVYITILAVGILLIAFCILMKKSHTHRRGYDNIELGVINNH